jgi:polyvinyl alcohol dehydrogenase (cytochrome)
VLAVAVVAGCAVAAWPAGGARAAAGPRATSRCDWSRWGSSPARTFATDCPSDIRPANVRKLRLRWFANTDDVVTATPAVVGRRVYVGDWSGKFYALDTGTGETRWTYRTKVHPTTYSGQIVSSAAVADVGGERRVFFGGGKTAYALRASDGKLRWEHELGRRGDGKDPTEIESSPVVAGGMVIYGWDVHNSSGGEPAGVVALDARTGRERWTFVTAPTTGPGATGPGCGDVWSSPAVDEARRLVIFGTGNCTALARWGTFSDAIVAVDLDSGALRWVHQPHAPNLDDLDFAGTPNLLTRDGRDLVGLGNKDGTYYFVDRATGAAIGSVHAVDPGLTRPGGNFSTGGFIGPTAVADGVVIGGTAVGPAPYLHGIDVQDLLLAWQNQEPSATYGGTSIANGLAFVGGTDFTLRAISVADGKTVWSHPMKGAVSGGAVVTRKHLYAVAGIREPGLDQRSRTSGVYRFSLTGPRARIELETPDTTTTTSGEAAGPRDCVGRPCAMDFALKEPPAGLTPSVTLEVRERPFRVTVDATGLGPPAGWLRPGTTAAAQGAVAYGVFMSERDDNPSGGLICILDARGHCSGTKVPQRGASYNRITLIAIQDRTKAPTLADGFERLITTQSFSPPLRPSK